MKRILLVEDDPSELQRMGQLLHDKPEDWEVIFVRRGNDALVELANQPCQVVCAALDTRDMPGTELLEEVRRCYPKTTRFLLVNGGEEFVRHSGGDLHHLLTRQCDELELKAALNSALSLDLWLANDRIKPFTSSMRAAGSLPFLFAALLKTSSSPPFCPEHFGGVLGQDSEMSRTFLETVNSAAFAPAAPTASVAEAVAVLGPETVASIVLGIRTWHELAKLSPDCFPKEELWRHQIAVASLAKRLVHAVTEDDAMANDAFAAGMLHDVGKLVFAAHLADAYRGAQSLAAKSGLPPTEVEQEMFGATHAEAGAYLLGFLGLPFAVLEAIALHHVPSRSSNRQFSPLTAVHVANVLVRQHGPAPQGLSAQLPDVAYLESLGMAGGLDAWRKMLFAGFSDKTAGAEQKPAALPAAASRRSKTPASKWMPLRTADKTWRSPRFLAPVACLVLVVASLWLVRWFLPSTLPPVSARMPSTQAASSPAVKPVKSPSLAQPESSERSLAPESLPPAALPQLKLQGIYYRKNNPAAVIDGKTLYRGDRWKGGQVVAINPQSVTFDFDGQRLTLSVKQESPIR